MEGLAPTLSDNVNFMRLATLTLTIKFLLANHQLMEWVAGPLFCDTVSKHPTPIGRGCSPCHGDNKLYTTQDNILM